MSAIPFSAAEPPEYVDEEESLMRDVETLRVALDVLDADARTRVMAHVIGELGITPARYCDLRDYLKTKFTDGDEWRGDHCPNCRQMIGEGVPHECRGEQMYNQRYIDIGR